MNKKNITLSFPAELIRKAKIYAAERDISINALVFDLLQDAVLRESRTDLAAARLLALADAGPYSSVDPGSIRREELYERV